MLRVELANGDYVLLGKEQVSHYRKSMITRGQLCYAVKIFKRGELTERGPEAFALRKALIAVVEQRVVSAHEALQLFFPQHDDSIEIPECFQIVEEREVDDITQVRVKALTTVTLSHPLHLSDPERTFIIQIGEISGWMPAHCLNKNVWVTEDSSLDVHSEARNSIISGVSNVGNGCKVQSSWVRNSVLDNSTVIGSVLHKSYLTYSDVFDCGLRNVTSQECQVRSSSISNCQMGISYFEKVRCNDASFIASILQECTIEKGEVHASHLIRSRFTNGNRILDSTLTDCIINEASVINSEVTGSKEEPGVLQNNVFVFGNGREGFIPKISGELHDRN